MPTGYTAGIIDGDIKTFSEFAKICMRAMGATVHMRDESLDVEYVPMKPSEYHTKELSKARKILKDIETKSDKEIISERKKYLEKRKAYLEKRIEEIKQTNDRLNDMLSKAREYKPPTPDHKGIKDFMIDQLEKTIDFDGSTKYSEESLREMNRDLENLNADVIRLEMIEAANKSITYHLKEHKAELDRCRKANQWVSDFLESI